MPEMQFLRDKKEDVHIRNERGCETICRDIICKLLILRQINLHQLSLILIQVFTQADGTGLL